MLENLKTKAFAMSQSAKAGLKKHGPQISIYSGVAFMVVGAIGLAYQTTKLENIIDKHEELKESSDNQIGKQYLDPEDNQIKEYSSEDAENDKKILTARTTLKIVKLYAVPTVMLIGGAVSIVMGTRALSTRLSNAMTSLAALSSFFDKYRGRVKDVLGEEVEKDIYYNRRTVKGQIVDAETGEVKEVEVKEIAPSSRQDNPYIIEVSGIADDGHSYNKFSATGFCWDEHDKQANRRTVENIQNAFNEELHHNFNYCGISIVRAEDVCKALGRKCPALLLNHGWVVCKRDDGSIYSPLGGDGYINFHIPELNKYMDSIDWATNGTELMEADPIMIELNCDGDITEWLHKLQNDPKMMKNHDKRMADKAKLREEKRSIAAHEMRKMGVLGSILSK